MTVSKKQFPRAVDRNLVKRRIRQAFKPLFGDTRPFRVSIKTRVTVKTPFSAYSQAAHEAQASCKKALENKK